MLSSEIATQISGRYVEIKMLPLSFKKYVESTGSTNELARKYASYIENSSFPYALELAGQLPGLKAKAVLSLNPALRGFSDPECPDRV